MGGRGRGHGDGEGEFDLSMSFKGRARSDWDADTQVVFTRNFEIIERAIAECRKAARQSPKDPFLRRELLAAYDAKIELLKTIADLEHPR